MYTDFHRFARSLDLGIADDRRQAVDRVGLRLCRQYPDLFIERRVADMQADEEAVQLRLGQRVRTGHVDRILGRQHHEHLG